jgi:hypothetical protein
VSDDVVQWWRDAIVRMKKGDKILQGKVAGWQKAVDLAGACCAK